MRPSSQKERTWKVKPQLENPSRNMMIFSLTVHKMETFHQDFPFLIIMSCHGVKKTVNNRQCIL